ncbi:hypothetical protein CFP56_001023, partial [Quercus suber]
PSRIQNTFNKPKVLTRLNPNLQTQAHPNSKNPKLKIALLFLINSDLHFASLWQQFFQNAPSKNLYNMYVHADPFVNVTHPKGIVFEFRFISAKKNLPQLTNAHLHHMLFTCHHRHRRSDQRVLHRTVSVLHPPSLSLNLDSKRKPKKR